MSRHFCPLFPAIIAMKVHPVLIPDCLTSGFVADLLGLRVSDLADALVELEHRGFVAQAQGSALRLTNLPELERLIESR